MHGAVWIADENRIFCRRVARIRIIDSRRVRRVCVLLLTDVEVVVDEELAEGDLLHVFFPVELVSDGATVAIVDDFLVLWAPKRQVIDRVSEVNLVAILHQLHYGLRAVVRAQMEVAWHLVHLHLPFKLAALFLIQLLLRCAKDDILRSLDSLLPKRVRHTLNLAIFIKRVLVQSAFNADLVDACHVHNIECKNCTWGLGQRQINI